jgi:hypothetical protein
MDSITRDPITVNGAYCTIYVKVLNFKSLNFKIDDFPFNPATVTRVAEVLRNSPLISSFFSLEF